MANSGPDKNGCQFYITTMESPWLNGKHTIFGKVVKGASFVHVIEKVRSVWISILVSQLQDIAWFIIRTCARLQRMVIGSLSKILLSLLVQKSQWWVVTTISVIIHMSKWFFPENQSSGECLLNPTHFFSSFFSVYMHG